MLLSGSIEPALFLAVDQPEMIKRLLSLGANPDATNWFGKSALMAAAQAGQAETVRLLIAAGANVNARSLSPKNIAENKGRCEAGNILHGRRSALMYAALEAPLEVIQYHPPSSCPTKAV